MKITLTKVVLVLGCLIVSDMMFNWGLPLGGPLFLLWLILAGMNFLYLEDKCKSVGVKTFIGQKVAWTYVCIVGIAMIWELKIHLILLGGIIFAIGLIKLLPTKAQRRSAHKDLYWAQTYNSVCVATGAIIIIILLYGIVKDLSGSGKSDSKKK